MSQSDIDTTEPSNEPKPTQFCEIMQTENKTVFVGNTDKQHIQTDMTVDLESWR